MAAKSNRQLLPIVLIISILPLTSANLFPLVNKTCTSTQYYDIATLQCKNCGLNQERSSDGTYCICLNGYRILSDNGGPPTSSLQCQKCPTNTASSTDRRDCIRCSSSNPFDSATQACRSCPAGDISNVRFRNISIGSTFSVVPVLECSTCGDSYQPDITRQNCVRCDEYVLNLTSTCVCSNAPGTYIQYGGVCFDTGSSNNIVVPSSSSMTITYEDSQSTSVVSYYLSENLLAAKTLCQQNFNYTACQLLANLCVVNHYFRFPADGACASYYTLGNNLVTQNRISNGILDWPADLPWLYYFTATTATPVLTATYITTSYSMRPSATLPSRLQFAFGKYYLNGTFSNLELTDIPFQLCPDSQGRAQAAFDFGVTYSITVSTDESAWVPTRRFFIIDNYSSKPTSTDSPRVIRYPKSINLRITLQGRASAGKIYPPLLIINYAAVKTSDLTATTIQTSFTVSYVTQNPEYQNNVNIACIVTGCLTIIYCIIKIIGWRRRCGRFSAINVDDVPDESINSQTMVKFFALFLGYMANCLFIILFGTSVYYLMFFKGQEAAYLVLPSSTERGYFSILFAIAFAFKALDLLHIIWTQTSIDIFFIDWEKPRGSAGENSESNRANVPISIWRTYFVANEWNEIQTMRKIENTFLIFAVLFFLEVAGFKNLATNNPATGVVTTADEYVGSPSPLLRFGIASICFLVIAFVQWVFYTFIYERFIEDKIAQFVDLCSMSNVSIFIMSHIQFGYYIHGKSVHGHADTDMKEMFEQLKREEDNLCGQRGLLPSSDVQTFQMALPRRLRIQYDKILKPLQEEADKSKTQRGKGPADPRSNTLDIQDKIEAYKTINTFLSNFVEHSLRHLDYVVRDKLMLERLLDMEFNSPIEKGCFYSDESHTFDRVLFYGNEISLLVFDILLFGLIDFHATNFVLAGAITYIVDMVIAAIRDNWGRTNLATKTLVDERFLI
ncbi:uncharacterized protein TRIADDRAFT_55538 [Trichoplax adhaerens]|uniref:Meckelin n=1 Tax=Trichoplax adhaerens TaxID=10228 RepID=B3RV61_TRIAD|nr:hypothetical protein TRIADDRAFT_55538 [Trichoplax adhaerens]EDV25938.1 hypothetical protein TRIADDRAFT_55538 [Trichoplax adhaerens]|eukprot:XP_002111971.1 hypothetical protein TRIADDRAFT_55538 [Trichoplax adhaerens]